MSKSVCADCIWKKSCQKLERLNGDGDKRNNPGHTRDIFEVIVINCSTKNYDRSYKADGKDSALYYCTECMSMHRNNSRIGMMHKKIP